MVITCNALYGQHCPHLFHCDKCSIPLERKSQLCNSRTCGVCETLDLAIGASQYFWNSAMIGYACHRFFVISQGPLFHNLQKFISVDLVENSWLTVFLGNFSSFSHPFTYASYSSSYHPHPLYLSMMQTWWRVFFHVSLMKPFIPRTFTSHYLHPWWCQNACIVYWWPFGFKTMFATFVVFTCISVKHIHEIGRYSAGIKHQIHVTYGHQKIP